MIKQILIILLIYSSSLFAHSLTLEMYLKQVQEKNQSVKTAEFKRKAALDTLYLKNTLTSPYLFTTDQYAKDNSQQISAAEYGTSRDQWQIQFGLGQRTAYGQNAQLYYQDTHDAVYGASPFILPLSQFHISQLNLELSQDLWRNSFGHEVRAQQNAIEEKTKAIVEDQSYQIKQVLTQSEFVYWQLSLVHELVKIQESLLDRSKKILDWVSNRVQLKLQDRSDQMQAQSDYQQKGLDLISYQDKEKDVCRYFNLLRDINSQDVPEELNLPSETNFNIPTLPEKVPERQDIRSLKYLTESLKKQSIINQESTLPELKVFVQAVLNGFNDKFSSALDDSLGTKYNSYELGVSLYMPIDYLARKKLRNGYSLEADSSSQLLSERQTELETEWLALRERLKNTYNRLKLARQLETIQKEKADNERIRLQRGNTTTFQMLQFEQDLGRSQLERVQIELEMLDLLASLKLFEE